MCTKCVPVLKFRLTKSRMANGHFPRFLLGALLILSNGTTAATTAGPVTTSSSSNQACIEGFLSNSPYTVPSLGVCTQLCEESSECRSVTFYSKHRHCSHFSSTCSNTVASTGATVVRFQARTQAWSWVLVAAYGTQCDFGSGEVYVPSSSGAAKSLSECLDSCGATAACRTATY